jgi:hypothetical protein
VRLQAEAHTDGVFGLVTSLKDTPSVEVLQMYKYQPYLEKRFSLLKSEYGVTPMFLKKPRRVVALLHVYFIAMMLSALLERQVRLGMRQRNIATLPILPEHRPTATPTTPRPRVSSTTVPASRGTNIEKATARSTSQCKAPRPWLSCSNWPIAHTF